MPNLLNGLVNGWVKVNNKHVIFPREDAHSSSDEWSSSRVLDRSRGKSSRKQSPQTVATVSTSQSSSTVDPEADAIRKFNNKRQNKRRLQRTISHTDLLREMAENKSKSSPDRASHERTSNHSRSSSYSSNNNRRNRTDDESVRLVAGFFGSSDVGDSESITKRSHGPVTTGKYLNESMFVQQLSERSKAESTAEHRSTASSATASTSSSVQSPIRGAYKRPAYSHEPPNHRLHQGADSSSIMSHGSGRFQPGSKRMEPSSSRPGHNEANGHSHAHGGSCSGCRDMENQLLAAYDDIRYLRDVSLRSEYSSAPQKKSSMLRTGSNHELRSLGDASKRLSEVTGRHRRQIEQMTRETVSELVFIFDECFVVCSETSANSLCAFLLIRQSRKQHDVQIKHAKMSMICKTLNDESSIRKQEAISLQEEVRDLKIERDELATQVHRLKAEASIHKQEQQEHGLLRERMTSYENHSLERADKAIRERDHVIEDLTMKLERTLETLGKEREQQRQRRQIIFPGSKSVEDSSATGIAALQEELKKAREAAKSSEALLEATRREAAKREMELTVRCEQLESRLKSNGEQ